MMALRMRLDVVDRQIIFGPGSGLSPQEISAQFSAFAGEQIAQIDAANDAAAGRDIQYETFVDGRATSDLKSVKPDGMIVADWALGADVVQWVLDKIRETAPVLTGKFRDSQRIYADGVEVNTPAEAMGAAEVVIASTVPYARKLEGIGRKSPLSQKAPKGVYQVVATMAQARFGNIAKVKFSTREIVGGNTDLALWAARHSAKFTHERKRARQHAKNSRQPAIIITLH